MESLLQAFGIDAKLIVVQILNFVILAAALSYLLYKPLLKVLDEREAKIQQGIADAEAAASAKREADTDRKAVLATAHKEAEAVAARAAAHAKEEAAAAVAAAEEKAADLLARARAHGEQAKAQALTESEQEVAKLAVLAAEKILREKV